MMATLCTAAVIIFGVASAARPLVPFTRGCGECRDNMVAAPQSPDGTCDIPTRRCDYAQLIEGTDGLDPDTGEIDTVNICDTSNLQFRRAVAGQIHGIPDDFARKPGKYRVSQCQISHGRDPSTWATTGAWKDKIAQQMAHCGKNGWKAGTNVFLDHKHRVFALGSCTPHCNDLLVVATAPGIRCHGTSSSTTTTTVPRTTTINPGIVALRAQLALLADKVTDTDATLDVATVQKEIKLIQQTFALLERTIEESNQGFQTQIAALAATQESMRLELDRLGAKPSTDDYTPTGFGCVPGSSDCIPSVATGNQGKNLEISAKDGTVTFETGKCGPTDLCTLTMQLQSLLDKLDA